MSWFFWYYLVGLIILWMGSDNLKTRIEREGTPTAVVIFFVFIFPIIYLPIIVWNLVSKK